MNERITYLLQVCLDGKGTEAERQELADYLTSLSEDEVAGLLVPQFERPVELTDVNIDTANSILQSIVRIKDKKRAPVFSIRRFAAAASVLLLLAAGIFYILQSEDIKTPEHVAGVEKKYTKPDVVNTVNIPNKTTLTLSDGSQIILDSASTGSVAEVSGIKIIKKQDGSLEYVSSGSSKAVSFNTLYNPPGGKPLRLTLQDGSSVVVNAASRVVFPTAFVGKERRITMEGEIYLEVARNKERPFYVATDKLEVQVLGTEFNVKNYFNDKEIEVTLKEGKVAVLANKKRFELTPNNQLTFTNKTAAVNVRKVNVSDFLSWKDGYYTFNGNTLADIARVLRRWYNVTIDIEDTANEDLVYTAIVYRNESLDRFMRRLEESSNLKCVRIGNNYYIR